MAYKGGRSASVARKTRFNSSANATGHVTSWREPSASGGFDEAYISAQQREAKAVPRVPRPDADPRWSCGDSTSPCTWPQAARSDNTDQADLRLGLPSALRLRKTRDYQRVQRGGRRIRGEHILVLFKPGQSSQSRVGITVSRKVGGAVTRNRVKRWLREAVRTESNRLEGAYDVVIIAHPKAASAGLSVLQPQVARALGQVGSS